MEGELRFLHRIGPPPSRGVGLAQRMDAHGHPRDSIALREHLDRCHQIDDPHPFLLGLPHLFLHRGHLSAGAPIAEEHFLRAETDCRARGVNCTESAADHRHPFPELDLPALVELAQEIHRGHHSPRAFPRHIQAPSSLTADPQEDRVESLLPETAQREILTEALVAADLHPQRLHPSDLVLQHFSGKTKGRNAVPEHSPRLSLRLEHRHLMPGAGQVPGTGETRRPGPDDGHSLAR